VLFTEANVVLPATILRCHGSPAARLATIARFWGLAWAGNLAGAFLVGYAIHLAQHYPADVTGLLTKVVARKHGNRRHLAPGPALRYNVCCPGRGVIRDVPRAAAEAR
jgi:formate/nitrite transporter FocA (FNT family)